MRISYRIGWCLVLTISCLGLAVAAPLVVQPIPAERTQTALTAGGTSPGTSAAFQRAPMGIVGTQLGTVRGSSAQVANQLDVYASTFERSGARDFVTSPVGPEYGRHDISYGNGRLHSLDMPSCSLRTTASTTFSYFNGIQPGDAYKIWFNPSTCSGCSPVYPFRVDSLTFHLVQADTGGVDTVLIGVDIECAQFDPSDSCNGPGQERCVALYSIALPADTANGFLTVYTITLPFDTCWVDGPFFAGIFHLGHTDTAHFHPNVALDGSATPTVTPCTAWANLSGVFEQWAAVWAPPAPGYPIVTLYGECNGSNPPAITPCPVLCSQSRIGGGIAFYDPTSTAVWEWIPAAPNISFPYKPQQINFSLYYVNAGSTDDSVQVQVTYGCQRLNDLCCAPSDVLCAGEIWLVRGNGGANFVLPVSLDLSAMTCCVPGPFWVGAQIVAVGANDPIPSFLWSSTASDPNPIPDCEQWIFTSGAFEHWPQGATGWWDGVVAGQCGTCAGDPLNQCTTAAPEVLNCSGATVIQCQSGGVVMTNQTNSGGGDNVTQYCCVPWDESGPEKVYAISVPNNGALSIGLTNIVGGDVDVMLLSACDRQSCVAGGDNGVSVSGLSSGTYYIVVDGFNGAVATFTITVTCLSSCPAEICNSLTPGTPSTSSRYVDGEWSIASGDTVYYTYIPNFSVGTTHYILKWNSATCDTFRRVTWTAAQTGASDRGLAYDPRNGGNFWTSTWLAPNSGRLYRLSSTGTVLNTFTSIAGIDTLLFSGLAFDPNHNHLWLFRRSPSLYAPNYAYELDVANPASPVLRQGPHLLTFQYPDSVASSGGADYAESVNKIVMVGQGTPVDFIQCYTDVDPAYAGAPPGPGLVPVSWCPPDSNSLQAFGLAAIDNGGDGTGAIEMLNFTDGSFQPHRVFRYPSPCPLSVLPCNPTVDLTVIRSGNAITVRGTAPQAGSVRIFSTTFKNNSGDPVGDPNFVLETTLTVSAGQVFAWIDPAGVGPAYKNYVVIMVCQ